MAKRLISKITQKSTKIKRNILLKNYTTFNIGGPAKYFTEANTKKDIIEAVKWAKEKKLPFFVLGGGSKLLIADEGFDGLVIKIQNSKIKTKKEKSKIKILAEAGIPLAELVLKTLEVGATGLEWARGIPRATLGGAIRGNAGAFEKEIADIIEEVEVLDTKDLKTKTFKNKDCQFGYRESIFKKSNNLIILSARLQFKKGSKKEILNQIEWHLNYRKEHHPFDFPSAGSIFKNPPNFPAGKLITDCGLKGKKIGKVQISEKHANFIINLGGGKAKEVKKLIKIAREKVKNSFGIQLQEELQYLKENKVKF